MTIHPENPADRDAVFDVHLQAFGQDAEARLVDALRDEGHVRVSLVAEVAGRVVGHILFSEMAVVSDGTTTTALALAPMAVLPEFQRQGIGSQLVRQGLKACRDQGHRIVLVVGHPEFYRRFGFSASLAARLESPYAGEAFMARELTPGAVEGLTGRVEYPPPFGRL